MCILTCVRTNIELDDELVAEAQRLTGITAKRAVVHAALEVLIEVKKRRRLSELAGRIRFAPGYDYKALREQR